MRMRLRDIIPVASLCLLVLTLSSACLGGGGTPAAAISRPGSIPTATPPASLPAPIVLGQSQPTGPAATGPAGAAGNTYTLQPGDTLFSVAIKLGVPQEQQAQWVADVLRLNAVADATLLKAGVDLSLPKLQATPRPSGTVPATAGARTPTATNASPQPTAGATRAPTQAAPTVRPTSSAGGSAGTYTVVSGDTPVLIAGKLGVPATQQQPWTDQLLGLNGVSATALQIGQILQLPPIPKATN